MVKKSEKKKFYKEATAYTSSPLAAIIKVIWQQKGSVFDKRSERYNLSR